MPYGALFLILAAACAALAFVSGVSVGGCLAASAALCWSSLASGYLGLGARVLLKRADGSFPPVSYLLHWPYFLLSAIGLLLVYLSPENPADEVAPRVFLGRIPRRWDPRRRTRYDAILDVAGEFAADPSFRRGECYRSIPLLDATAPTVEQLLEGVRFVQVVDGQGTVLIHCALGHSRSATFAAAYLLATGLAEDPNAAVRRIQAHRSGIRLNAAQFASLQCFAETLAGDPSAAAQSTGREACSNDRLEEKG